MACGSVWAKERQQQVGREPAGLGPLEGLEGLGRRAPPTLQHRLTPMQDTAVHRSPNTTHYNITARSGGNHEAIRFLQAEHEKVLDGLHKQIQALQQRCDDLQFDAHLRHITAKGETEWQEQVDELTTQLEEREASIQQLQTRLDDKHKEFEDAGQHNRWREVQLQQQVQVGEQKVADLREECLKLRAKVRDLKVYSAALRKGGETNSRSESRSSREYEELDEPLSLESEEPYSGNWRETRLSKSLPRRQRVSGSSIDKPMPPRTGNYPPPEESHNSKRKNHRPISVILPPINLSQSVGRPQFRQQTRFASAPPNEPQQPSRSRRPSDVALQRRKDTTYK